jgi:hypothetical protein
MALTFADPSLSSNLIGGLVDMFSGEVVMLLLVLDVVLCTEDLGV